jgi:hypothetical protein
MENEEQITHFSAIKEDVAKNVTNKKAQMEFDPCERRYELL